MADRRGLGGWNFLVDEWLCDVDSDDLEVYASVEPDYSNKIAVIQLHGKAFEGGESDLRVTITHELDHLVLRKYECRIEEALDKMYELLKSNLNGDLEVAVEQLAHAVGDGVVSEKKQKKKTR